MNENNFIGISGIIGAGKTTLAEELSKVMGLPVYYEPVIDNVYLADFYKDMKRYAFNLQVYLLNRRFSQHQQIIWNQKGGIQDRTIYEDNIFAKILHNDGFIDDRDYETYMDLFKNMSNFMKKNTLIVHLDVTPEQAMERIKDRARGCEVGISLDYLKKLYEGYEEFLSEIAHIIPVIRVKYDEFHTAEEMALMIKEEFSSMKNVRRVFYT